MATYKPLSKKKKLGKQGKRVKWAPFWAVMKRYGTGKKIHPSSMTAVKRNWRQRKLKIKPRRLRKEYLG